MGPSHKTGDLKMNLEATAKKELIDSILKVMVTPSVKISEHSSAEDDKYNTFIKHVNLNKDATAQLPLDYALKDEMFNLIKNGKVFVESSVKFVTTFTTKRPSQLAHSIFTEKYVGNEFNYSFLDNHPGIINIDKLKDIPIDYEGLMAVPPTVLEYKNLNRFNVYRILYAPKYNGKSLYPRIVVSNKVVVTD